MKKAALIVIGVILFSLITIYYIDTKTRGCGFTPVGLNPLANITAEKTDDGDLKVKLANPNYTGNRIHKNEVLLRVKDTEYLGVKVYNKLGYESIEKTWSDGSNMPKAGDRLEINSSKADFNFRSGDKVELKWKGYTRRYSGDKPIPEYCYYFDGKDAINGPETIARTNIK
ncbi:MAG: hypothetical protein ABEK59_06785 [Halobacteria archaeon]